MRIISVDGEKLGVMSIKQALQMAQDQELDLVEISPNAEPPVCRIMDFGKYLYQKQKKLHEQKHKRKSAEQKQIRIKSFKIDPHDLEIKVRQVRAFIEAGSRVLITIRFSARENEHPELGKQILVEGIANKVADVAKVDSQPQKDGKRMTIVLAPVTNYLQVVAKRKAEEERAKKAALAAGKPIPTELLPSADELLIDDDDDEDTDNAEE